ncbi:hypothetical protein PYCC9005_003317 [Savitreella phatthalungensis]
MPEVSSMLASAALLALAIVPIRIGAIRSCGRPPSVRSHHRAWQSQSNPPDNDEDDEDDYGEEEEALEYLSTSDALLLPVIGGAVLTCIYVALKYLSAAWLNLLLRVYFCAAGVLSVARSAALFVPEWLTRDQAPVLFRITRAWRVRLSLVQYPSRRQRRQKLRALQNDEHDVVTFMLESRYRYAIPVALIMVTCYFWIGLQSPMHGADKSKQVNVNAWPLTNALAISFAIDALQLIKLDSFATAYLLLSALLAYDAFFVFKTPIMVAVASGLNDLPIKLVVPRDCGADAFRLIISGHFNADMLKRSLFDDRRMAMLGLGDVVIPGIFVALCRRFDAELHYRPLVRAADKAGKRLRWARQQGLRRTPFFRAAYASYIIGLVSCMTALHVFQHAQPALIYLSPACMLAGLYAAWSQGVLRDAWQYDDSLTSTHRKDE